VINFFFFVAEDLRQIMADMGFRTIDEMIGRVDRLDSRRALDHWKAQGVDLSRLLHKVDIPAEEPLHRTEAQNHGLDKAIDNALIAAATPALDNGETVRIQREVRNINRTVGAMLSGEVARRYGHEGLPDNTIQIACTGNGGQSFGAFLAHGITLDLTGDANDYVGKGLSGGRVIVKQPSHVKREPTENIIVGNTVLYGAIAGEAYFNGVAGERFAVRNSGAIAVVEGTGDHGCEYMTGGVVAVLGKTGRNFAAGMSGGIAYVYDEDGLFRQRCNMAMVDVDEILSDAAARDGSNRPRQRSAGVHDYGMGDILYHDAERLRILLERHHLYTGSTRARALLDDWATSLGHFVRVMPRDYARALKKIEADLLVDAKISSN
jgi:glutamate synthase (NADPH/NADH) large chain